MTPDKKHLEELWRRYVEERATPEELNELFAALQDEAGDAEHTTWAQQAAMSAGTDLPADPQQEEAAWQQLLLQADGLRESLGTVHRIHFLRKWGWAAAAIVLMLGAGSYFWIINKKNTGSPAITVKTTEIPPGKEGAVLTLADGSQVQLDTIKNGVVALQGGVTAKVTNGRLLYEGSGDVIVYNTMTTPKGREYQVTLPDGTHVWLNAASSIRYPTAFTGKERRVMVTGEAYFEVVHNAQMPFKVNVGNNAEVAVLGTHFNVNAYENEKNINTTLLQGSIAVTIAARQQPTGQPVVLQPGQQAQISSSSIRIIKDADLDKVMAWKNGLFNFQDLSFEEAMHQLERWYDIDVVYENGVPDDIELNGKITKGVMLNDLLTGLGKIGLKCRLEGRKLIVMK